MKWINEDFLGEISYLSAREHCSLYPERVLKTLNRSITDGFIQTFVNLCAIHWLEWSIMFIIGYGCEFIIQHIVALNCLKRVLFNI